MSEPKRISEARSEFSDLVNRAAYRHERVLITRHGKAIAAVVPAEDFELLEALEDRADLEAMSAALADPANAEPIPWEQVKAELGL
jgi:prevent-host-death family protein